MGHISKSNLIAVLTRFLAKLRGEVVDNLESTATNKPLSAKQGKLLGQRMSDAESDIDTLEGRVATLSDGDDFKGKVATIANLPAASDANKKHKYWVTAQNAYYKSTGSEWVELTNSYETYDDLDSDSATNALSARQGKELNNKFGGIDLREESYPMMGSDMHEDACIPMDNSDAFESAGECENADMFEEVENSEMNSFRFLAEAPASSSSEGKKYDAFLGADYFYVCVADNSWKRFTLSSF